MQTANRIIMATIYAKSEQSDIDLAFIESIIAEIEAQIAQEQNDETNPSEE